MFSFCKLVDYSDKYSIYFSSPKTWVMWAIVDLHDYIMFFLINIFIIVIIFLCYCLTYRYKYLHIGSQLLPEYVEFKLEDANHAPNLEFFWTMVPIGLLFLMGWPSFKVLYAMEQLIDPFHTVIIVGNQWYWTYQYSDFDVTFDMIFQLDSDLFYEYKKEAIKNVKTDSYLITGAGIKQYVNFTQFIQLIGKHFRNYEESQIIYDSVIIPEENLPLGYPRLLSVDQVLVLPCNVSVRLLVTSADVIHSWALPSQGIKMDAIPGRINQVPFLCNFWGTYWGQCSELCGINHGFMPIEVRVVPFQDYMLYLNLNLAFRYEKFQPLLVKFFSAYVNHLKYVAEKDLYIFVNDAVFNSNFLNKNEFIEFFIKNNKQRLDQTFYSLSPLVDVKAEDLSAEINKSSDIETTVPENTAVENKNICTEMEDSLESKDEVSDKNITPEEINKNKSSDIETTVPENTAVENKNICTEMEDSLESKDEVSDKNITLEEINKTDENSQNLNN